MKLCPWRKARDLIARGRTWFYPGGCIRSGLLPLREHCVSGTSQKHFFWPSYIHWVLSKTRRNYHWELVALRLLWGLCFCRVDDKMCLLCKWYIGFYRTDMSVSFWFSLKTEKASRIRDVTCGYVSPAWPGLAILIFLSSLFFSVQGCEEDVRPCRELPSHLPFQWLSVV